MKTIQEHLRELDRERLIEDYEYRSRNRIVEAYCNVEHSEIADLTLKAEAIEQTENRTLETVPVDNTTSDWRRELSDAEAVCE